MSCQCCGSQRNLAYSVLTGLSELTCYRCWRWFMLLFIGQRLASDKWVRDSEED
jgi:hypothetical protein